MRSGQQRRIPVAKRHRAQNNRDGGGHVLTGPLQALLRDRSVGRLKEYRVGQTLRERGIAVAGIQGPAANAMWASARPA